MYGPAPPLPLPVPPTPLPEPPSAGMIRSGPPEPATAYALPADDAALLRCEGSDSLPQPVSPESPNGTARQSSIAGTTRPEGVSNFEGLGSLIGTRVSIKVEFEVINVGMFENRSGTSRPPLVN